MLAALVVAAVLAAAAQTALPPAAATITIDAGTVEGRISPLLYGQFIEFMYEGIKRGLDAELIRNRGFEEERTASGLSRDWARYPDDRIDDYGISCTWDDTVAYPDAVRSEALLTGHSLRVQLRPGVIARHGVYQGHVPVKQGVEYRGYVWIRAESFTGTVTVALEGDRTGGAHLRRGAHSHRLQVSGDSTRSRSGRLRATRWRASRFSSPEPGTVWIDQVSLVPGDRGRWRPG